MKGFEERLDRLEELSGEIRSRDIPIEKAMQLFDEGIRLSKELEKELAGFERKVGILANEPPIDGSGEAQIDDFEEHPGS